MPKKPVEHVGVNTSHKGLLQCLHCGATYTVALPCPVDIYVATLKAFENTHRGCKLRPEGEACTSCLQFGHKPEVCTRLNAATPQQWLQGPDTGLSSMTICRVALGETPERPSRPRDPEDFGRCHRLLKLFPEMRARLPWVSAKYSGWGPLVREWDALAALYEEERPSGRLPKLYARMQELLAEGDR